MQNVEEIEMKTGTQHRRRALAIALSTAYALGPQWALANPNDAQVVSGQVSIQSQGNQLNVTNSAGAIINWRGFSIGAGETTRFIQPSASSAVLNRVVGPDISQLLGQLKSNGQVYLINPNGIVVGAGAHIDTNSFVASTLDMADADFLAGKLRFLERSGAGSIRNEGLITAGPGGRIALIAPNIENSGIIQAPDGNILLAAGRKLEITSLDMEGVRFEIQAPTDSVLNLGKLLADNGAVRAFAGSLRQSGEIRATRMALDAGGSIVLSGSNSVMLTADSSTRADGAAGGQIMIQSAEGTTRIEGVVSAKGLAGAGGDIGILGERVALDAAAQLDASGTSAGGQILVGGDYQGRNPDVQNAQRVFVGSGVTLNADATASGNGGRVIVWADENTRYQGSLSARGGAQGGDGGFAEVSGKQNLEFSGSADLGATAGRHGSLLLDPLDILVSLTSGILPTVVDEFGDFASTVVTVSPTTLAAVAGNVVLQAERDIHIRDAIALTTSGAGITMTAGGALFNAGGIINTAGITTNAGTVSLRGQSISGAGGITTTGGAVDLMTAGSLNYSGPIISAGGTVTLASQTGSVNSANVDAGSGTILVTGSSINGGSFLTTGTVDLTATAGSINVYDIGAAVANLNATSSVNASVNVTDRVNATSTGSSVELSSAGSSLLRLGAVTGNSGIYLYGNNGMEQASGGLLTSRYVYLYAGNSVLESGAVAAPLRIASPSALVQPEVGVYNLASGAHLEWVGNPTLARLTLQGTVAGLGASTVVGASNFSALTLGAGAGVLNLSAVSTAGLANGFEVTVTDGTINASTLTLPGSPVQLSSTGAVTVGTMTGDSLYVSARGAVNIGSATTTGSSGIYVSTQACNSGSGVACAASSPIAAGTLNAGGTGDVDLYTYDNGNISVTNLTAGDDVSIEAGRVYSTSFGFPFTSQPTTNNIVLGTVVAGGDVDIRHRAQGDVSVTSLSAARSVYVQAGTSFRPSFNVSQTTTNNITIGNSEPVGAISDFQVDNSGLGNVTVSGNVDRSNSGSIYLSASEGNVTATGNLTARDSIYIDAGGEGAAVFDATLGQLVAGTGASNGDVSVFASRNVTFGWVTANAISNFSGEVTLSGGSGFVRTTNDNTGADIVATGNVTINAGTSIGNSAFANPLDIQAGATRAVTLRAGQEIGTAANLVHVDTGGTIDITSSGGQFHVSATDGMNANARSLSTIRLSASAAGIGSGSNATFVSSDLSVTAASDGTTITIDDLLRSAGTLDEFKFAATGTSNLTFGDVNLNTAGLNQLILSGTNGLSQVSPLTNTIVANGTGAVRGNVNLAGGAGATTVGDVTAWSVVASGASLAMRNVTSTGTRRANNFGAVPDKLNLTASGNIVVDGNLVSATVIDASSASGNLMVTGAVTGSGASRSTSNAAADRVRLNAGGTITTGGAVTSLTATSVTAGGALDVNGNISGGILQGSFNVQTDTVTVSAGLASSLDVDAIVGGFNKTVTGGTLNVAGGITGGAGGGTTVNATTFNTGDLQTTGSLTINATAAYAPVGGIALSGSSATITAPGGIDLVSGAATLTAPTVTLRASGGDIAAALTNTSNLTINTGGEFNVTSTVALTSLAITADGQAATANGGSSVSATGQLVTVALPMEPMVPVAISLTSPSLLSFNYTESSAAVTDISLDTTGAIGAGSQVTVDARNATLANITAQSVAMNTGGLSLLTKGDINLTSVLNSGAFVNANSSSGTINLTSVNTGGGSITAATQGDLTKHVNVQNVVSLGGNVTLTAGNGSIVGVGASSINSSNGQGLASGTTQLRADNGAIGSAATPINTAGAVSLVLRAKDAIEVDVTGSPLTNLTVTTQASGSGMIDIAGSGINFTGLSIVRSGSDLLLGALSPVSAGAFSLTVVDGNIMVGGDVGNVTSLALNAGSGFNSTGDLRIAASTGPRSLVSSSYDLRAGQDVLITAGATAPDTVSISQTGTFVNNTVIAGRDILLTANGGTAALSQGVSTFTQTVSAGRDLRVTGGSASGVSGATAAITSVGSQSLRADESLVIQGGASDGATARITATQGQTLSNANNVMLIGGGNNASAKLSAGTSQSMTPIAGTLSVQGGTGSDAFAEIVAGTSQNLGRSTSSLFTDLVQVQGGTGTGTYASMRAGTSQNIQSSGDIRVLGNSATGSNAEIMAGTSQTIGSTALPTFNSFNDPTAEILVQAGSGGTARILAAGTQTVRASERIMVIGGSGTGMSATIETTVGNQTIGSSSTFQNDPTGDILVQGGVGGSASASIKAAGFQTFQTGGRISVLGGSGAGASSEILSTGSGQSLGSTSTNSNDPTDSILVQAGSGGIARIQAQNSQTILAGGDLSVLGGSGTGMIAAIQSMTGSQSIGNTSSSFFNDPSGSIVVQAGSGSGSAAFINAATGQTIDAGGVIHVNGNASGAYAEIVTAAGNQTIGNVGFSNDRTDSISLAGGTAAGSYARIAASAGFQTLRTSANLSLTGGSGDNAGATLLSGTGQSLTVQGSLAMLGGSGSAPGLNETAIRNSISGTQTLNVTGDMSVTGGGIGSDTWIKQDSSTGNQSISVDGNLALLSPAATTSTGVTSIEALGPNQSITVGGAMSIVSQAGRRTYVGATGTQSISADSLGISLSSAAPVSAPFAGVTAGGNQIINLYGDGTTVGTATLSIFNTSSLTDSSAAVSTAANQTILMDYNSAGLVQIGSTDGLGKTQIVAGGTHTMVAGQLLIQGGASAAATAALMVPNDAAVISTIYGPIEIKGGALGAALIDPPQLDMVSNNGVFLLAGAGPSASATINAGTFNLAATQGDLSLISSAAAAAITANVFNYFGAGNVNLAGGTITVSQSGSITITGICYSCDTNLFGKFSVFAFVPPPTDFGALAANNLLALADLGFGQFDAFYNEDGELELRNRRLNQCY
jgi:filamentous hemagglutinin family protein